MYVCTHAVCMYVHIQYTHYWYSYGLSCSFVGLFCCSIGVCCCELVGPFSLLLNRCLFRPFHSRWLSGIPERVWIPVATECVRSSWMWRSVVALCWWAFDWGLRIHGQRTQTYHLRIQNKVYRLCLCVHTSQKSRIWAFDVPCNYAFKSVRCD